ncbi:nitroreductase family protein [Mesobacillus harenae]|uniref:nitroreductase family protein n=1 Tax=Mesobacillus harenae TaxID=2213203 RepID=UPI00158014A2|nr:nitroreductase family protein [Mesobacillus harenae]
MNNINSKPVGSHFKSPSSLFCYPCKGRPIKKTLSELCGSQRHVKECPVFLVFCADLNRIKISHELEEKPNHLDTVEPFIVATVDASIYGQNVLLASELLGLGGVFIGGIRNQPEKVSQLLKIPEYVYPVFGMCIGYPDSEHLN